MSAGAPATAAARPAPAPPPGPGVRRLRAAPGRRLATLLLPLLAACAQLPELDLNPLLRIEQRPDGAVEIEALGPLIALRDGPDGFSHALRPLYQHKANHGLPVTDWLAPFGRRFVVEDGTRWRFWPLVWAGETRHGPAGDAWNLVVFPVVFAGDGPADGDGYFALWPLGGRMTGLFGLKHYDFALWPLFMRTEMDITEPSVSWTVLLGAGWTTGGPRDGSWRILPFYRHRLVRHADGTLRTDQRTVAWPFVTWGQDFLDTSAPSRRWAVWPFVGRDVSDRWVRNTWLWPFLTVNRETVAPEGREPAFRYDLPWPILHWARDEQHEAFRLWPFYSRQEFEDLRSTAWLIPLGDGTAFGVPFVWQRWSRDRTTSDEAWPRAWYERSDTHVVPFWHSSERRVEGREGLDTQAQAWPFVHHDRTAGGRLDAGLLSLVPVRNYEFLRPFEELWSPFWTLARSRSDGRAHEQRLLFDLVVRREDEQGLRISVPVLYSRRPEPGGVARHAFLWGLVTVRADQAGTAAVSLLGLDLWRR